MFQHFIITPFSFRRPYYVKGKFPDPLKPSILKERFRIFEIITLASLKAQENQDFTLIIIVDPLLPDFYRKKFLEVTSGLKKVILHDFTKIVKQNTLTWLQPYVADDTKYLLQTKIDADDALFKGFTQYVQDYYKALFTSGNLPPIHFTSGLKFIEWDFFQSKNAPNGYLKISLEENDSYTISSGLTFCSQYPEMDISVMGIIHTFIGRVFQNHSANIGQPPVIIKQFNAFKERIKVIAERHFPAWDGELMQEKHFHSIQTHHAQALVLNFFLNDQFERIFEHHELRVRVNDKSDFPEIKIDFEAAVVVIKDYHKSLKTLLYLIWRQLFRDIKKENMKNKSLRSRISYKKNRVKIILDGYKKLL